MIYLVTTILSGFGTPEGDNIRRLWVAVESGGLCQWQLNSLKVSFRIADNIVLVKRNDVINTSYIFDFGEYGLSDGYGTGRAKGFSEKRLHLNTDIFPMVANHIDNTVSLKLFGWRLEQKSGAGVLVGLIHNIQLFQSLNLRVLIMSPIPAWRHCVFI